MKTSIKGRIIRTEATHWVQAKVDMDFDSKGYTELTNLVVIGRNGQVLRLAGK